MRSRLPSRVTIGSSNSASAAARNSRRVAKAARILLESSAAVSSHADDWAGRCPQAGPWGRCDMSGETLEAIGIHEILAALPHRYPFLLVDRIIEIRGDEHGIGIKNVTANVLLFSCYLSNNRVLTSVLALIPIPNTAATLCMR